MSSLYYTIYLYIRIRSLNSKSVERGVSSTIACFIIFPSAFLAYLQISFTCIVVYSLDQGWKKNGFFLF